MSSGRMHGFSLLEMMAVVGIVFIATSVTVMSLQPGLRQQRITNAYNTTMMALRLARDSAIAQRTSYVVTFNTSASPNTITVAPTFTGFQGVANADTYSLPSDVSFDAEPGIPTNNLNTPDRFGTGKVAVDLGYTSYQGSGTGGSNQVYFCPDGTAQDAAGGGGQCQGNWNSGVIYIARPGELSSSRAITLWGSTGRIRGWRLYTTGGATWQRQ